MAVQLMEPQVISSTLWEPLVVLELQDGAVAAYGTIDVLCPAPCLHTGLVDNGVLFLLWHRLPISSTGLSTPNV